jgi:hypothetical protein
MKAYFLLHLYQLKHQLKALILFMILLLSLSWLLQIIFVSNSALTSVPIALVDADQSPTSQRVVASILKKDILNTTQTDFEYAYGLLKNHKIEALVHIKPGFEKALMSGQYEKLIDMIYLDRSVSAPALTDILAGSVLKEACAYNAILLVQRYDDSDDALEAISQKVRTSIEKQEYSVPLEMVTQLPQKTGSASTSVPFENQLPIRLAIGYSLFSAFLISALYATSLAKSIIGPVGSRLTISPHALWTFCLFALVLSTLGLTLFFGTLTFYFYGFDRFVNLFMPIQLLVHFLLSLLLWQFVILILALVSRVRSGFYTFLMPTVVLIGLLSGYFWPLDFISKQILKPLSFYPTIQLLNQYENLLLSQPVVPIHWSLLTIILVLILLLPLVTKPVTILKK